ncbi:hypothetical protein [Candidatus Harpocratesius sp.]
MITVYRQGEQSLDKVYEQLLGLITAIVPQYRSKSFVYLYNDIAK